MPENPMNNRVLEIDGQPPHLPDDIAKLIAPVLAKLREEASQLGITIRAGESFDAEFPSNHSSYFVLVGSQRENAAASGAAQAMVTALTQFCNQNRCCRREKHATVVGQFYSSVASWGSFVVKGGVYQKFAVPFTAATFLGGINAAADPPAELSLHSNTSASLTAFFRSCSDPR